MPHVNIKLKYQQELGHLSNEDDQVLLLGGLLHNVVQSKTYTVSQNHIHFSAFRADTYMEQLLNAAQNLCRINKEIVLSQTSG